MTIKMPDNAKVIDVDMGESASVSDKDTYLFTCRLRTCTAVAVSVKDKTGGVHKFLAHTDMGENIGTIDELQSDLQKFISGIDEIKNVNVVLVSSESFHKKCSAYRLVNQEQKLVLAIKTVFEPFKQKKVCFKSSTVAQIRPTGEIVTPKIKD